MINFNKITKLSKRIKREDFKLWGFLFFSSLLIVFIQLIYLNLRYGHLLEQIPLFYTRVWGDAQLVAKDKIFIIPAVSLINSFFGLLLFYYLSVKFYRFGTKLISFVVLFSNLFLTYSLFRIVTRSLKTVSPLVSEDYIYILFPFIIAVVLGLTLAPLYTKLMRLWGVVTDPKEHSHPAMILENSSARGGGLFFALILIFITIFFIPLSLEVIGVLFGSLLLGLFGFADDYQNTHPNCSLRFLENPLIRLGFLFFFVSLLYFFNIKIEFLTNPLDGILYLDQLGFLWGNINVQPIAWFLTTVWIVWVLNLLSWSNGVDGQYTGLIGLSLVFIGLLGLRFEDITSLQLGYARLAFIAAGASFGLLGVTWYPSKIMWGFGAMSSGIVLASLSTLLQTKVITSILILFIPFLDAFVTLIRRLLSGRNPLRGDRGHLHHLLLDYGLSVPQVALFYWLATLLFGGLSLYSAEKPFFQAVLMGLGLIFFIIVLGNLRLSNKKKPLPEAEK